jgi:hypothetical protein
MSYFIWIFLFFLFFLNVRRFMENRRREHGGTTSNTGSSAPTGFFHIPRTARCCLEAVKGLGVELSSGTVEESTWCRLQL